MSTGESQAAVNEAMVRFLEENPNVAAQFIAVLLHPPKVGSVRVSFRDGKPCGCEVITQTY